MNFKSDVNFSQILLIYLHLAHGLADHVEQLVNTFKFPHCRTGAVPLATHALVLDKV